MYLASRTCVLIYFLSTTYVSCDNDCDRVCLGGQQSRKCIYKFVLEETSRSSIVAAKLTINGQSPGPTITACHNDVVTVDVINKLNGLETTIHWHGVRMINTPFMDGVGMVTQCPIQPHQTFRYQFRVEDSGTFPYYAHSVHQQLDGLYGVLLVKDHSEYVNPSVLNFGVEMSDFLSRSKDIETSLKVKKVLVNGRTKDLFVQSGNLVILVNNIGLYCPLNVSGHVIVVGDDGSKVRPKNVDSLVVYPGDRYSVVVQKPGTLRVEPLGSCSQSSNIIITVGEADDNIDRFMDVPDKVLEPSDIKRYVEFDEELFDVVDNDNDVNFEYSLDEIIRTSPSCLSERDVTKVRVPCVNGRVFGYTTSPLLTQRSDVDDVLICDVEDNQRPAGFRQCCSVLEVAKDETFELFLVNKGVQSNHTEVFHFHGHHVHVLGQKQFQHSINKKLIQELDKAGLIQRQYKNPPLKDTVTVPSKGFSVVRIAANNPGYWLIESRGSKAKTGIGYEFVLYVHEQEQLPAGFLKCGDFKPEDSVLV